MYRIVKAPVLNNGNLNIDLCNEENNEIKCNMESEFENLIFHGEVIGLEELKGSPSLTSLCIMLLKGLVYQVVGRFEEPLLNTTGKNGFDYTFGYVFKDEFEREYVLRIDEAMFLVQQNRVSNAKINPNRKYLEGIGCNLTTVRRVIPDPNKVYTIEEMNQALQKIDELAHLYGYTKK